MNEAPGWSPNKIEESGEQEQAIARETKLANAAINATSDDAIRNSGSEYLREELKGADAVKDHFPEGISPKEHFEREPGPSPFRTEEDYKEAFDLFLQQELVPKYHSSHGGKYSFELTYRPYKETVQTYLEKTRRTIKDLSGESGKLPKTDVAIYLDKSARPVSWFVNEFWEDFTDKPRPQTEHLVIDRKDWFSHFGIRVDTGEYLKDDKERLAGWMDLPIHDVTKDEIMGLCELLSGEIISHEELNAFLNGDARLDNRIRGRAIDIAYQKNDVWNRVARNEITNDELEAYKEEALASVDILNNRERLKNINEAMMIAVQIRGLFVPGGLSEEDVKNPERIMGHPVDMDDKNITIVDEVVRTGTTGKIAKQFVEWAFPEAASVNFYDFYQPKRLYNADSSLDTQMLMIPFWYPLDHDDGTGRGINGPDNEFYKQNFEQRQDNKARAAYFGADFLGVPIDYEKEEDRKSIRLREQIARLRVEHEKGHI